MNLLYEMCGLVAQPRPTKVKARVHLIAPEERIFNPSHAYALSMKANGNNKDKPCSVCHEKPRHVSKTGKAHTTMCIGCYKEYYRNFRRSAGG